MKLKKWHQNSWHWQKSAQSLEIFVMSRGICQSVGVSSRKGAHFPFWTNMARTKIKPGLNMLCWSRNCCYVCNKARQQRRGVLIWGEQRFRVWKFLFTRLFLYIRVARADFLHSFTRLDYQCLAHLRVEYSIIVLVIFPIMLLASLSIGCRITRFVLAFSWPPEVESFIIMHSSAWCESLANLSGIPFKSFFLVVKTPTKWHNLRSSIWGSSC